MVVSSLQRSFGPLLWARSKGGTASVSGGTANCILAPSDRPETAVNAWGRPHKGILWLCRADSRVGACASSEQLHSALCHDWQRKAAGNRHSAGAHSCAHEVTLMPAKYEWEK